MTKQRIVGALAMLGVAGALLAAAADAAEIKVISTGSFKAAFGELAPAFEKSSGTRSRRFGRGPTKSSGGSAPARPSTS
jgi:ABC-type molybdate transport system substrate-binding protein